MTLRAVREMLAGADCSRPIIVDGAVGTQLLARGVPIDALIRTNIERPSLVRCIHNDYLAAGAQLITSNSFAIRSDSDAVQGTIAGVHLALEAVERHHRHAAVYISISPVVADHVIDAILAAIPERWASCILLGLETCLSLTDTVRRIQRIRSISDVVIVATCVFDPSLSLRDGGHLSEAAPALLAAGADLAGANCFDEPADAAGIAKAFTQYGVEKPVVRPNAGKPAITDAGQIYPLDAKTYADLLYAAVQNGATVVGGCCGTTPDHIRALAQLLQR